MYLLKGRNPRRVSAQHRLGLINLTMPHEEFVLVLVNMPRELAELAQWAIHRCDEPELVDRACLFVIC